MARPVEALPVPVVTARSTVVLAAQLALDHLKCFAIEPHDHGETVTVAEAEAELKGDYGWDLMVPPTAGAASGQLVAVRRSISEYDCKPDGDSVHDSVEAAWAEGGELVRYIGGSLKVGTSWDSFRSSGCDASPAPPEEEVRALQAEFGRIRDAFLRP